VSATSELRLPIAYQINVILWALDRAQTLEFSLTSAFETLPFGIFHRLSRQIFWF